MGSIHCECGELYGERCAWEGDEDETVVVEYMPRQHRTSHVEGRNRGTYPHNGAALIRVHHDCAESILETDGDWASIVTP